MGVFTSRHKQTKKSYLANTIVAVGLALFMLGCIFFTERENHPGLIVGAAVLLGMAIYFFIKHKHFDRDKDKKHIMDDLMF